MKKFTHYFLTLFSLLTAGFLLVSLSSNAADVVVPPGRNTLVDAVNEHPGSTFILERGKVYLIDVNIAIDEVSVFKAADGDKALAPPVIQYFANPGEAGGKKPFMLGASTTFEGIGFFGYASGAEMQVTKYFYVTAADIDVVWDGCVFQAINHILEFSDKNNNTYTFKNNVFYNICKTPGSLGSYGMLWGGDGCDFQTYNNTYFMVDRVFNGGGMVGSSSETMNHNTYVNTWGDLFYPSWSQNYTSTNNIHYNAQIRGYVGLRKDAEGEVIWKGDFREWDLDTLVGDISIFPHANDSLDNDGPRKVLISNNIKMYDQTVNDFFTANNITPMTLWNVHGREIFAPRYGWEFKDNYLQEDNNAIDPGFVDGAIPADSYRTMFLNRQNRHLPPAEQDKDFPYQMAYLPEGKTIEDFIWPLPFDFTPANKEIFHLGSDGYPIGDLNWFAPEVLAAWEAGLENPLWKVGVRDYKLNELNLKSYPNPFNSLTTISYDLPGDGIVTVSIFSVSGAQVAQVVNEYQGRGQHEVVFDGSNLSSGIYFCKVQVGNFSQFGKMSIVK